MRTRILLTAASCLLLAASTVASSALGRDGKVAVANWTNTGGPVDESGFSRLTEIHAKNADKLGLAWALDLDGEVTLEATPLAVDGVLYFTGSYSKVYAVDAASGKVLWTYDPKVWERSPQKMRYTFGANRGLAYDNGKLFLGALDGYLTALDAKTGRELWKTMTVPENSFHNITGAPRVFNGKVIIGNSGADANVRGYVTAYDQATGKQAWRFYTVPGAPEENKGDPVMEMAAKTWTGEYWKIGGGGGTVWNGITFDPELNRIYIGVGNAGPYNPRVRNPGGGDNLFIASIVALDADTGKYVWHYQQNPNEAWDYKSTANMIAATLTIDGKPRKVLMQQPTNGFFYVLDRETGKLISAEKVGKVTWAERIDLKTGRPVEAPNIRYEKGDSIIYPSAIGTHNWQAMSFNPQTGLVYIPYMQIGTRYTTNVPPGNFAFAGMTVVWHQEGPEDGKGALLAWDPVKQKAAWKAPLDTIWNGGTLTTAGNLVFQGAGDGWFSAYDATTGARLWRFNAGLGIIAAPISYTAGGKQYVSVLVGYGGATAAVSETVNVGWKYGAQPRRLLTFALGGKATLPPAPGPDKVVHAVDDPSLVLDEKDVAAGRALSAACIACHGIGFKSPGAPAPDLRESQVALQLDSFSAVVKGGALRERGMPSFEFSDEQVRQLHAYVRATAREALGTRKPDTTPVPSRL